MAFKIYFRRFTSLLLCGLLVFCSLPVQVHATDPVTAASLAITGGQLAGAGLSGEAALSLAGPVGAVVGITLGALGINAYVSQASQEAGKTRTRFVLDKLVLWGAQAGYTKEQLYSKIAEGISVAADGTIQLGNDVAQTIQQFGNWLTSEEGEVIPALPSAPVTNTVTLGNYTLPVGDVSHKVLLNGQFQDIDIHASTNVATVILADWGNYYHIYEISTSNTEFVSVTGSYPSQGYVSYGPINGYYYNSRPPTDFGNWVYSFPDATVYTTTLDNFLNSLPSNPTWDVNNGAVPADDVFIGSVQDWTQNRDVLNPSANDTPIVLNPDLLNPIIDSLTDGQQATMSIIDYLEALQDAWDHALDDVQTAIGTITDSLTGIQEQIAVPQDAVANPTVTNPSVTPETTPVLDPSAVDPGTAVTGLSFDLTQIFPFCIPFDIYDMLATLSATPEAPVYHVHYEGPYNIVIDFTVDLSPWDSVAAVLRTVELLAFCIGLAYVTRSMFIRS